MINTLKKHLYNPIRNQIKFFKEFVFGLPVLFLFKKIESEREDNLKKILHYYLLEAVKVR